MRDKRKQKRKIKLKDGVLLFISYKENEVKHTTLSSYQNIIDKHIKKYFSDYYINEIETSNIVSFKNLLLKSLSPKRTKDILILLKEIITFLKKSGYKTNDYLDFKFPKFNNNTVSILTAKEEKELVKYCIDNLNTYTLGILLSLYTGLRIGEICALTFNDIDFNNNLITVSKTLIRSKNNNEKETNKTKIYIDSPKTIASNRIIPIPYFLCNYINNNESSFYVITGSSKYIEPCTYYKKYKKILYKLKISNKSFHSLRHTFATNCLRQGVDLKTLSEILGHSNVNVTINRYVHSTINDKIINMNKLKLAI